MEIVDRQYVILDIHPDDFYYDFRDEMIGQVINISYGRPNRTIDPAYTYCFASFDKPIIAENIIIEHIVFRAVKLGEMEDVANGKSETKANQDRQREEAQTKDRAQGFREQARLRL